jgi:hemolysin activation/secretion protein
MNRKIRGITAVTASLFFASTDISAQQEPIPIIPGNDQRTRQQEEARERE